MFGIKIRRRQEFEWRNSNGLSPVSHYKLVFTGCICSRSWSWEHECASSQYSRPRGINPSRIDVFLGYSYFGAHGQLKPQGISYSSINEGGMASFAYYMNKYVGGEFIASIHPDGKNDGFYSYSAGPIFRAPMQNFTLFAHGLVGGGYLGGPNSESPFYHNPYRWGPTLTAGGGMDYDLPFFDNRFSLRLFQAD